MTETNPKLATLNALGDAEAIALLADIFEHSPWVPETALAARPFDSINALHAEMVCAVASSDETRKLALLNAHPELGGDAAREKTLTASSNAEQSTLGLEALPDDVQGEFDRLNAAYRDKFGFPFIIAVRNHTLAGILNAFRLRLDNTRDIEIKTALGEVASIARIRLDALFSTV